MKRIILLLLSLTLSLSTFAASPTANKDKSVTLTGNKTTGDGYTIFFGPKKDRFIKFSGYARLHVIQSHDKSDVGEGVSKMGLDRFRLYMDGQSSNKWSFHTRWDYDASSFMNTSTDNDGLENANSVGPVKKSQPGVYFARAYVTYKHNPNFKISAGRLYAFAYTHDVFVGTKYALSNTIHPVFTYGNFTAKFWTSYEKDTNNSYSKEGTTYSKNKSEIGRQGGLLQYTLKFAGNQLSFGTGADFEFLNEAEKYRQYSWDVKFATATGLYILNQTVMIDYDKTTKSKLKNYTEVGYSVTPIFTPDLYLETESFKENTTKKGTKVAAGLELSFVLNPEFTLYLGSHWEDITDEAKDNYTDYTHNAKLYYNF